jgi:hypothetical protein
MRRILSAVSSILAVVLLLGVGAQLTGTSVAWAASSWAVTVKAGSHAQTAAQAAPAAPATSAATCVSGLGNTVKVSWSAVAHATDYTVREATAAASGPYTAVISTSGTSWTSASLSGGTYWFDVVAIIGTLWTSPASVATGSRTITLGLLCT